jgi:hypothetical protein
VADISSIPSHLLPIIATSNAMRCWSHWIISCLTVCNANLNPTASI